MGFKSVNKPGPQISPISDKNRIRRHLLLDNQWNKPVFIELGVISYCLLVLRSVVAHQSQEVRHLLLLEG